MSKNVLLNIVFTLRLLTLYLADFSEREEVFYVYEQGNLQKKDGFYIYYEKNPAMQEYMLKEKEKQKQSETVSIEERNLTEEGLQQMKQWLESNI